MGKTPARTTGRVDVFEETQYEDRTADGSPTVDGAVRYVNDDLELKTPGGVVSLTAGTGLTVTAHKALRQLIHFIDHGPAGGFASGAFFEILPDGNPFPTSEIWWESNAKSEKIVELTITRDGSQKPTTEVWKMYDTDGSTILATVTDTITYTGPFVKDVTRAIA
jgi:hypothetical protein